MSPLGPLGPSYSAYARGAEGTLRSRVATNSTQIPSQHKSRSSILPRLPASSPLSPLCQKTRITPLRIELKRLLRLLMAPESKKSAIWQDNSRCHTIDCMRASMAENRRPRPADWLKGSCGPIRSKPWSILSKPSKHVTWRRV